MRQRYEHTMDAISSSAVSARHNIRAIAYMWSVNAFVHPQLVHDSHALTCSSSVCGMMASCFLEIHALSWLRACKSSLAACQPAAPLGRMASSGSEYGLSNWKMCTAWTLHVDLFCVLNWLGSSVGEITSHQKYLKFYHRSSVPFRREECVCVVCEEEEGVGAVFV